MKDKYEFYVAGVQFHQLKQCIDEIEVGEVLDLMPEPTNKYDPNAIALHYYSDVKNKGFMIGYVPGKQSAEISAFIEIAENPQCIVQKVTPEQKPWLQLFVSIEDIS
jgi:hypothetical protein